MSDSGPLIPAYRLYGQLRIASETLRTWSQSGYLPALHPRPKDPHYTAAQLDAFLASCARGYDTPPTIAQLLSGEIVLLTISETMSLLDMPKTTLLQRLSTGAIRSFKLKGAVRVDKASVEAYIALNSSLATTAGGCFTRQEASHITGCSSDFLGKLIESGALATEPISNRITRDSLAGWLKGRLPDWLDPHDWIEDRLAETAPLMYPNEVLKYLGMARRELRGFMIEKRLHYITTPGGLVYFSPESVRAQLETQSPLLQKDIVHILGPARHLILRWIRQGRLRCGVHEPHENWYKPCVLSLVAKYLGPGLIASNWYEARQRTTERLVGSSILAASCGVPARKINDLAKAGVIPGIRSPGDENYWYFTPSQARKVRQALQAGRM